MINKLRGSGAPGANHQFNRLLAKLPTPAERDKARIQAINGYLRADAIVMAVRLSRSIESPSQRFALQMERFVEPHLYDDHHTIALELLSDDFAAYAKTLPTAERLPLLAKIAKKIAQMDGRTNWFSNEIDYVLKEAAKCVISNLQPLTAGERERLVEAITCQWGNFRTTSHHDRLIAWLNKTY
ncbi:MAG: hypothetical protein WCW67_04095 [Candidatus Margulisiibacteriota bacterium]|jgi:hypothetical protein